MTKRVYDFRIDVRGWSAFDNDDEWQTVPVEMTDEEVHDLLEKEWAWQKSDWFKKNYDAGVMDDMIDIYAPEIFRRVIDAVNAAAPKLWPDAVDKTDLFDIYLPRDLNDIQCYRLMLEANVNNKRKILNNI